MKTCPAVTIDRYRINITPNAILCMPPCAFNNAAAIAIAAPIQQTARNAGSLEVHQKIVGNCHPRTAFRKSLTGKIPREPIKPSTCKPKDTNAVRYTMARAFAKRAAAVR